MLRKQAAKSSKEKSTTSSSTASSRSTTAARLADYTGAQSAPLAGYGITTVPGLYQTMSQSPGSPGLEGGATGGFSAAALDTTDDIAAGVSDLAFHQEKKEKVRISCVMQMTSVVRWLYDGRNMPSVRFLRYLLIYCWLLYGHFQKKDSLLPQGDPSTTKRVFVELPGKSPKAVAPKSSKRKPEVVSIVAPKS